MHIVLIPGFAGFDALGQVEYYAGITPLFQAWKKKTASEAVLHYFDNFPTAAVVTRAGRLRAYLAKRIVRGEISDGDEVILAGHSTGGLDIRQLIYDLHDRRFSMSVDGGAGVSPKEISGFVRRVVFLSVPHWGTNIADWVRSHRAWREAVVAEMRAGVAGSQVPILDRIGAGLTGVAAGLTGAELLLAAQDALTEANERNGIPGPERTAAAHEAASELALYLRQTASDFRAIDDLASERPKSGPHSPAQFDADERGRELEMWDNLGIRTLSYATVSNPPFRFARGKPAPVWELSNPFSYPEIAKDSELSAQTDMAYRLCYRACAGGPFRWPDLAAEVTRTLNKPPQRDLELWDNDGIVNTLSMLWPRGDNILVAGDHLDIVGHFQLTEADPGGGRKYRSYDALKSRPEFSAGIFRQIWTEIFDFCAGKTIASRRAGRLAAAAAAAP